MTRKLTINKLSMEDIFTIHDSKSTNMYNICKDAANHVYAIANAYYKNASDKSSVLYHSRQDMDACERILIMAHHQDAPALMALSHMIPRLTSPDKPVRSTLIEAAATGEIDYTTVYYAAALTKALANLDNQPIEIVTIDVAGRHDEKHKAEAKKALLYIKQFYERVAVSINRKLSAKTSELRFETLRINQYSIVDIYRMHAAGELPTDWDDICGEASLYLLNKISHHLTNGQALEHHHFDVCEKLFFAKDIVPALFYFRTITASLHHRTTNDFYGSMRYTVATDTIPEETVEYANALRSMFGHHSFVSERDCLWGQAKIAEEAQEYYNLLRNYLSAKYTVTLTEELEIFAYPLKELCEMDAEDVWPSHRERIIRDAMDTISKKATQVEMGILPPDAFTHKDVDVCERLFLGNYERLRVARIMHLIFRGLKDTAYNGLYGTLGQDVAAGEHSPDLEDYINRLYLRSSNTLGNLESNSRGRYSPDQVANAVPLMFGIKCYYDKLNSLVKQNKDTSEIASLSPTEFSRRYNPHSTGGRVLTLIRHRSSRADATDEEVVEATEKLAIASYPTDDEIQRASRSYSNFLQENAFAGEIRRSISELKDILFWAPNRLATTEKRTYTLLAALSLFLALVCALPPVRVFMDVHTIIYAVIIGVVFLAVLITCISNVGGFLGFLIGVVAGVIGGVAIAGIISIFRYSGLVLMLFFLFKAFRAPAVCRKNYARYMNGKGFAKKLSEAQKHIRYLKDRFDRHADCEGIETVRAYYAAALTTLETIEKSTSPLT